MEISQVLSYGQKIALITLYLSGIRGIAFQGDSLVLYREGNIFAGNFHFKAASNIFDFSAIEEYMGKYKIYSLCSIIQNFCPEYIEVTF